MKKREKFFPEENNFADPKLKKNPVYLSGRLSVNRRGFGFVMPEDGSKDIFVGQEEIGAALHGDKVKIRLTANYGANREGEIVEVLERARDIFVGTLTGKKKTFRLEPDDEKINFDIPIKSAAYDIDFLRELRRSKKKIAVKIFSWKPVRGEILEVLGGKSEPGVDISEIILSHGAFENFPAEVLSEAKKIETEPPQEEISKRIDRRDLKIVTIDGEDAKDLDDGVFAQEIDGGFFLGVYIADVSHYVRAGSPLDLEAFERGTSIYPVDRVVPMLPEELSNGICSLNAGENRLAMACEMKLDPTGKIFDYKIFPTVIRVFRRLSYAQVNKFLRGETSELADCAENLNVLLKIYELRKKIRRERGAIDFNLPELKIKIDENRIPIALTKKFSGVAENIIEECMLAANETVAEHTLRKKIPSLYRVHELPTAEKLDTLNSFLSHFSLHISAGKTREVTPKDFQKILERVKGKPTEKIISNFALRAMQQARYSTKNLGHFGLAAEFYTHFTSPIRRYPDLIVHRMLRASLESPEEISKLAKRLEDAAKKSSERERRAVEIERETLDLKSAEYMKPFVGKVFDGVISGVTNFGFFVELENGVDGLVRAATLRGDFYVYVESEFALIGKRTGKTFHIGDNIRVKLVSANVKLRQLTFELVEGVKSSELIATI